MSLRILCLGVRWQGSDSNGLFNGFQKNGNLIYVIDELYFINFSTEALVPKAINKIVRPLFVQEYNQEVQNQLRLFKPHLMVVFKGAFLKPESILVARGLGTKVVNFFPDVSMFTHGSLIPRCLPYYDHIFTTKTFGQSDLKKIGISSSSFIPHGFDPDVHLQIEGNGLLLPEFKCDVSFIGGYSEKKADYLSAVAKAFPKLNMKIWGARWEQCRHKELFAFIQHKGILGHQYAMGINSSKINLGLLHEKVMGSSSGDLITSRTFHIPGAGGFLLHERNTEIVNYFKENEEIALFESSDELCDRIGHFLKNESSRQELKNKGHQRAHKDHTWANRAATMLDTLYQNNIL